MGQKIYIVKFAVGEYDSYYEYIDKAFYEKDKAAKYVIDKNAMYKRLESYRDEWEEIETLLDNAVPDNSWEIIKTIDEDSNKFPEYWSDTEETFINAVKKTLPEIYEKNGEIKLLEMYHYFRISPFKWEGPPQIYINETEIE